MIKTKDEDMLTMDEFLDYTGYSESKAYKMTSGNEVPHYKSGRKLFFNLGEVREFLSRNKIPTKDEI